MTINISPRVLESLSAYLDGQLSDKERVRLEKELQADANLRATLEDLRRTRSLLRNHPRLRAPRNFTLTPAMVGARPKSRAALSLFPALRLGSALASFVFVLVVIGEFIFLGRPVAAPMIAAQAPAPAGIETQGVEQALLKSSGEPSEEAALVAEAEMAQSADIQALSTEAVALKEATQESPPEFPIDVPPETFSEAPSTEPRMEGGGVSGLGGGEGLVEELAMEAALEGTPLPDEALSYTTTITASEMIVAQGEAPLAEAETPDEASQATDLQDAVTAPTGGWSAWRWTQVILAFIALTAGALAFFLRRTGRA